MRKVEYYEYEKEDGKNIYALVRKGEAVFLEFGVSYDEFDSGVGQYSTAIIELPSGEVKNIPVEQIKFVSPQN